MIENHSQSTTYSPLSPEELEEIRQENETFLTQLEALVVRAIATGDWDDFYVHLIEFQSSLEELETRTNDDNLRTEHGGAIATPPNPRPDEKPGSDSPSAD